LWQRDRDGRERAGLIHHSDAGSQYTSFRLTAHLAGENIAVSIGTVGDALDNALRESAIGLYKTELINRRGPWRTDRRRVRHRRVDRLVQQQGAAR
jgi:putative transposase